MLDLGVQELERKIPRRCSQGWVQICVSGAQPAPSCPGFPGDSSCFFLRVACHADLMICVIAHRTPADRSQQRSYSFHGASSALMEFSSTPHTGPAASGGVLLQRTLWLRPSRNGSGPDGPSYPYSIETTVDMPPPKITCANASHAFPSPRSPECPPTLTY